MGGAISGLIGVAGGNSGTGFSTPSGTNQGQILTAYNNAQTDLTGQQNLLNALQGQNGLNNQSQTYNQFQNLASGNGPNPAQSMLNQATGQNVANQAALMAGQRGASANPGLIARQAAQQGANIQQQAAGQGATMQAQQALGALGQAANQANTMAGQQIGQTNALSAAQQNEQGILQGANSQNNVIQGQLANTTMQGQQAVVGGAMNAIGAIAGLAKGGMVQKYAVGGNVDSAFSGPQSMFGQFVNSQNAQMPMPNISSDNPGAQAMQKGMASLGSGVGGKIRSAFKSGPQLSSQLQSPALGTQFSSNPDQGQLGFDTSNIGLASGGNVGGKLKSGGHVPGSAKVKGDSYKNDTVKAVLSPGEIVIPRSVAQGKDPVRGAAQFVAQVMAKKRMRK